MFSRKIKLLLCAITKLIKFGEWNQLHQADIVFIVHADNRGFNWRGLKYSPLLDTLKDRLESLGAITITLNTPFSNNVNDLYGNPKCINGIMARAELCNKLVKIVRHRSQYRDVVIQAWSDVISAISAKVIIAIQPSIELCVAAERNNVWVADMQHGIISGEGYYGSHTRAGYGQRGWPSCVLCWDKNSAEWLETNASGLVDVRVIGNPWFIRFQRKWYDDQLVKDFLIDHKKSNSSCKKILISLQYGDLYTKHKPTGIPAEILRLIKKSDLNYEWWIRLHPVLINELGKDYLYRLYCRELKGFDNAFWVNSTELPLPMVLNEVDLHLTFTSSTTKEASWFGIPTALLYENKEELFEWYKSEIYSGIAEIIDLEENSIECWLKNNIHRKNNAGLNGNLELMDYFVEDLMAMTKIHECIP